MEVEFSDDAPDKEPLLFSEIEFSDIVMVKRFGKVLGKQETIRYEYGCACARLNQSCSRYTNFVALNSKPKALEIYVQFDAIHLSIAYENKN